MPPSFLAALLALPPAASPGPAAVPAPALHGGAYQAPTIGTPTHGGTSPGGPAPSYGTPVPGSSLSPASPGASPQPDLAAWPWWWELHKEPFLELKARVHSGAASTGSDGFFLGRGTRSPARRDPSRPTTAEVQGRVVPALLRTLEQEDRPDVVTGVLMALAKTGEDHGSAGRRVVEEVLGSYLPDANQEVSETATIALGVLAAPSSAALLAELLLDTAAGRAAVGRSEVPWRTRSFAAFGLGVLGAQQENEDVRRFVVHRLARALEGDRSAVPDVKVACIVALGRVPLPPAGRLPSAGEDASASRSRECQVLALLAALRDDRMERLARAHVPVSLGLLLDAEPGLHGTALEREVVLDLVGRLGIGVREPKELQQSCAIALGLIGDDDEDELDARIRRTLLQLARGGSDTIARDFALVSLARVGARRGTGDRPGIGEARELFLALLSRGSSETVRWAGISAALLERWLADRGDAPHEPLLRALRVRLQDARSPLDVGAFAVAAGLVRDREAAGALLERLAKTSEDQARGHVAIALGLLRAPEAVEPIRRIVDDATYRPLLLREAATGLGLLGDERAAALLIAQLERASSQAAQASIAQALARVGDRRALEPLLELLERPGTTTGARAFAAAALGGVADRRPLPWGTILSVGLNHAAATPTLYDDQGLGVLNIL